MNKKLTLLLDETIISQAKEYARKQNETLSGMVEKYFSYITTKNPGKVHISTSRDIEELSGIIKVPDNYNIKEDYRQYRSNRILSE